jgi:hypothetical protein
MGNKIPQKSFDAQMHIIRDVHFDVDKYIVGELYVINLKDPAYLSVQGKTIAQLTEAKEHELKFKALALNYDPETGNSYNTYGIGGLGFTIDDIIDRRIEIERLLTETEAAVYLASVFVKESANDLFKSQLAWQKGPVGVNYFCTPEKHQDDTSKECAKDIEAKQSTLDPKNPKFNRLLGIVPDHSQFPYTLERTHSYQELQAAYKNDDAFDRFMKSEPITVKIESESAADTKVNKRYVTFFYGITNDILINGHINVHAFELDSYPQFYYVYLKKGETTITMRVSPSKMHFLNDRIIIGDRSCSTKMVLHVDTMCDMFDEIVISDKQ